MALLVAALVAVYVVLTVLAAEIGLPVAIAALAPIPIAFGAGAVLGRAMRSAGVL